MNLKPLIIGSLKAEIPIIQGGMGVGISLSSLAGAVAKEGAIGVISAAMPGYNDPEFSQNSLKANLKALSYHIKRAKEISNNGIIGVNIMRASKNYAQYVKCCIENNADIIISGAGLPVELPELVKGTNTKFAPIISPFKAAKVLFKLWDRRYNMLPDLVIIEGPKAGGHLGFTLDELNNLDKEAYDKEVVAIMEYVRSFEDKYGRKIPVVFGGGVYDKNDIEHYINLGLDGVQIATRFVATYECDASEAFKNAYINAKKDDIVIVKSPVGMPGRAIKNKFIELHTTEKEVIKKCYDCLDKCDKKTIPYCITGALVRAVQGDVDNSLVFCGENAYKINKIVSVHDLIKELTGK